MRYSEKVMETVERLAVIVIGNPGGRMNIPVVYYSRATAYKADIIIDILFLKYPVHRALYVVCD